MTIKDSWSMLYESRKVIRENFPNFWKVTVQKKPMYAIKNVITEKMNVLDVGSYNRGLKDKLKNYCNDFTYKSMDIDRSKEHDYYSFEDIKEKFDIVFLFEVIEHLDLTNGVDMLKNIHSVLKVGGKIVLTTPNVFHPNRYWESTHKVSYRYDEIGGLLSYVGFDVKNIFRIYNDSFFKRFVRLYITSYIHEYFSVDFAKSILIIGEKD